MSEAIPAGLFILGIVIGAAALALWAIDPRGRRA